MSAMPPEGSIVVSCQAPPGSPLRSSSIMAALAVAAVQGGAAAIRASGAADVAAIRAVVDEPLVGLVKRARPDGGVTITPSYQDAAMLVEAGADIVAVDATLPPRVDGVQPSRLVAEITQRLGTPVLADVDTLEAARRAVGAGAAAVATTLAGYTTGSRAHDGRARDEPDVELVGRLAADLRCPVFAEGRYRTPGQVRAAFAAGATGVIIGTAITDPVALTRRFVAASPRLTRGSADGRTTP